MKTQIYSGSCGCGAVRFKTTGKPKFVGVCHCSDCRNYTGAAFSTFVGFLDEQVKWLDQPRTTVSSSSGVTRGFCADCGTPMSYQGHKWAGETHLLLGTFDDPEALPMQGPPGQVFEHEKLSWVKI